MPSLSTIQSIYIDRACTGNPSPGVWGIVVYFTDNSVHELGGAAAQTTNNRMEMQAAIADGETLSISIIFKAEPLAIALQTSYTALLCSVS